MKTAIGLSPETFARIMRVVRSHEAGANGSQAKRQSDEAGHEILRVASSTPGTYGYPAKYQSFDESDGSFADSADRPETVYLVDPTGAALKVDERYDARFVGFRGASSEAVYEVAVQIGARRFPLIDAETGDPITGQSAIWRAKRYFFADLDTGSGNIDAVTPEYAETVSDQRMPILADEIYVGDTENESTRGLARFTASDIHFSIYHLDEIGDYPAEVLVWLNSGGGGEMITPGTFNAYAGYLTQDGGIDYTGGSTTTAGMTFLNGLYISGSASLDDLLPIDLGTDVTGYLNAAFLTGTVDGGAW